MPSGLHSRVKMILSSAGPIYEVQDDANRNLYVTRSGTTTWLEVELD